MQNFIDALAPLALLCGILETVVGSPQAPCQAPIPASAAYPISNFSPTYLASRPPTSSNNNQGEGCPCNWGLTGGRGGGCKSPDGGHEFLRKFLQNHPATIPPPAFPAEQESYRADLLQRQRSNRPTSYFPISIGIQQPAPEP